MNQTPRRRRVFWMMTLAIMLLVSTGFVVGPAAAQSTPRTQAKKKTPKKKTAKIKEKKKMPALDFKMKDIDGNDQKLGRHHGNVILMVNTASQCGLTPQYEGLQALYKQYDKQGFTILAFPANNFGRQEPGANEEIKAFCSSRFQVKFPLYAKVSVKGRDICDLYKYLTNEKADHKHGGEIEWNFAKFLINREGEVVKRFHPRTTPDDKKLVAAIEKQLATPIPADSPLARKKDKGTKESKRAIQDD